MLPEDVALALARRVAHANAHEEAVELRFGQRVRSVMFDGVLRGQDEKRLRQPMRLIVHGDLRFVHRFEQRRLRLGRRAIDFVGEHDIGEDRPGLELERLRRGIEHADAGDVGRQQIRSELDALKRALEGAGQRLRQRGLAHPAERLRSEDGRARAAR